MAATSEKEMSPALAALWMAMQPVKRWMDSGGTDPAEYEEGCYAAFSLLRHHGPTLLRALCEQEGKAHACDE
jgi:hypothetical protein